MLLLWWIGCGGSTASGERHPEATSSRRSSVLARCRATSNRLRVRCQVEVDPPQPVRLEWWPTDGSAPPRAIDDDAPEAVHRLTLSMLPANREHRYRVVLPEDPQTTSRGTFWTGRPPTGVGSWLDVRGEGDGLLGTEMPCGDRAVAVIYDAGTGDLVWYQDLDPDGTLGMMDMVRFTERGTVAGETGGQVVEVDTLGRDLARFEADGLHHELLAEPDGFVSLVQERVGLQWIDRVVGYAPEGTPTLWWVPEEHLVPWPSTRGDVLHTNAIARTPDGGMLLSWYAVSTVAAVDPDGEIAWLLAGDGDEGPVGNDLTVDWSGVDGPDGFSGQHDVHLTRDGRLVMLDDHHGRGLVLTVDAEDGVATVDGAYPTAEATCGGQGTATDTPDGEILVACPTDRLRAYDEASGELDWEARIGCRNGRTGWATRWYALDPEVWIEGAEG
ncbi:MAG: hypothetical protein H6738_07655 [Alphaproteobacteria bacterium]|nr:hypothetical protein [Alphaproteobacteria bacterium]MCB9696640.1 hypothetical protein [Alphaproteobacteria bacterium]